MGLASSSLAAPPQNGFINLILDFRPFLHHAHPHLIP